ncbi:hypothetical protein IP88_14975 [alpha proteobacterium AAP81b]|nr:hypothetical protein IP88_14975 [alpha proteobacterium AAP81b]
MRREQNLALLGAVVSGAVIATGLILLIIARVNPDGAARLRGAMLDLLTPVWSVVRLPFDGIGRGVDVAGDYFGAVTRARRLEAELAEARAALQARDADRVALMQLRRVARVAEPGRRAIVTTRIVAATAGAMTRTALIAAGRSEGVTAGLPVVGADGLIGRTIEAGSGAARVLLLTDPASRIPVTIVRTGQAALVVGANRPRLELRDRVGADVPLAAGDRLVTSGDGGVFPPGIPVGTIVDPREPPQVRPAASPLGAAYVRVEAAYLPLPADSTPAVAESATPVPVEALRSGARPRAAPAAPALR